ncbi:MAG: amino acid adenylation domain-containing protein, partial [Gammaproteobacteria bacterium]|nr:amino acid adenylation domain-containing protein [Gammaproteobacteria bacterium]
THFHHAHTIETLAKDYLAQLQRLINHCTAEHAGGYTPSDFPLAHLDQTALDAIYARTPTLDDIYPLSPMQQGILFNSLFVPESRVFFEQLSCHLTGPLNLSAFNSAWHQVVNRHAVLKTAFAYENAIEPYQLVYPQVDVPLIIEDWREIPSDEQPTKLKAFLKQDMDKGFDLESPPLLRLALLQTDEDRYYFILSFHHILMDGWSFFQFLPEVFSCYKAFNQQQTPQLPQAPLYKNYISWLQHQDTAQAEAFWKETLRGFTAPTGLGIYKQAPVFTKHESIGTGILNTTLNIDSTNKLQQLAKSNKFTLNTVLQGLWALLLGRYNQTNDVCFGVTVYGRPAELPQIESTVGLFINTLPLRINIDNNRSLLPWLSELQAYNIELRKFDYVPLPQIQTWSELPAGNALFQTLLVFENYPQDTTIKKVNSGAKDGQTEQQLEIDLLHINRQTNLPLSLIAAPGEQLQLEFRYDQKIFSAEIIERLANHFTQILEQAGNNPELSLGKFELLGKEEYQRLVVDWNKTATPLPNQLCAHQLFENQATQKPEAKAITFNNQSLSYSELNEKANRLAHYLRAQNAGPEIRIGLCVDRSLEMIVGILGILKAGCAYVPIDPSYPQELLNATLKDSKIKLLLTVSSVETVLPDLPTRVLNQLSYTEFSLDTKWDELNEYPTTNPRNQSLPNNLAYVIYTSGSTGRPKGVQLQHGGLSNLIHTQIKQFAITETTRTLQFASVSFDTSVWEIFGTLAAGGTLYIANQEQRHSIEKTLELIKEQRVNLATLPPSAMSLVDSSEELPELKTLIFAGEACPVSLVQKWAINRNFYNAYGPTENTVCISLAQCDENSGVPPIGRPIQNVTVYLLDSNLNPVPQGAIGELYVGGGSIARGYLNQPGLTADKFLPNPFSQTAGERMYKTGDLARFLPDGNLEYQGRIDHQVKLRGFRIELGEIEFALRKHPGIREAAVLLREDKPGEKKLAAYLVAQAEMSLPDSQELRSFIKSRLPEYMVPASFINMETLPLTPNGKVDRRALPAPDQLDTGSNYIAPQTTTEKIVAQAWMNILKLERVGINDNFFELGGHSLIATQLVASISQSLGEPVPINLLFDFPTVGTLAERIEAGKQAGSTEIISPITRVSHAETIPLSFAQLRVWFMDQLFPGNPFYNALSTARLQGNLDIVALNKSLNAIVARHEAMRTVFVSEEGKPHQVILKQLFIEIPIIDLSELSEEKQNAEIERLAVAESERPFELEHGPLLRAQLLLLDHEHYAVFFNQHHVITDGWSLGVLIYELATLYNAFSQDKSSPLPPLPVQYPDFSVWQRKLLQGEFLENQLAYWREELANVPADYLSLPIDKPRELVPTYRGAGYRFTIPEDITLGLNKVGQANNATMFMTLLAAFQILLSRYSGQTDFCIGIPTANRHYVELEPLIGAFVNTLAIRTKIDGNPTFGELLETVRKSSLGAYAHQDLPFERLVDELKLPRDMRQSPLFQVMFAFKHNTENYTLHDVDEVESSKRQHVSQKSIVEQANKLIDGLQIESSEPPNYTIKFELELHIAETSNGLSGVFQYTTDLFEVETIERFVTSFQFLLRQIAERPDTRLSELAVIDTTQQQRLLVEYNDT